MSSADEEARAALYRAQERRRYAAWLRNWHVTLAPARGAYQALLQRFDPLRQAQLEAQIVEPDVPPFIWENEEPPFPMPKRNLPLP